MHTSRNPIENINDKEKQLKTKQYELKHNKQVYKNMNYLILHREPIIEYKE